MRVLVQLSCLVCVSAFFLKGPDADRFCDRGTKAQMDGQWFCCPATCGGQCLSDQDKCDESKKHNGDTYNPSCCIPEASKDAKQCDASSAPCAMEKEWNKQELAAYRQDQFEAATNQKTKKFKHVVEKDQSPIEHQQHMEDNYNGFYKKSKAWTDAESSNQNPMTAFSDAFNGCQNLFRKVDAIRGTCVHSDGTNKDHIYSNHQDHKMESKRRLGNNQLADYYWGHNNADAADAFIRCVAGETNAKCGTTDSRTAFGEENALDCDECSHFV